jgi:putative endonuclease
MRAKDALGRRGEDAAVQYLMARGWHILERNWRCPEGELDIVARDGADLVVCEVKTRSSTTFGTPAEAVTPAKFRRLRRLAMAWLVARGGGQAPARVDILGLVADGPDRFLIEHIRGCD